MANNILMNMRLQIKITLTFKSYGFQEKYWQRCKKLHVLGSTVEQHHSRFEILIVIISYLYVNVASLFYALTDSKSKHNHYLSVFVKSKY